MAMTTPQTMDRQTFLSNLRQSGLVTGEQMAKVVSRLPDTNKGVVLARALIEHGLLTRFQAELLLVGRTNGFHLGQYRILDHLGRGGMGRVFKAEHQTMNRVVAIKVLAPHLVKTPKAQQLFQREVRAAAKLVHPNIVTAYDANQIGDRCYLVMEYVDGPNLEQLVQQQGPLPVGLACDFIRQAAGGLQYAHELGMVHRDIKPANLLAQRPTGSSPYASCSVKILDFGLARLHTMAPDGTPVGNDSIMAAENTVLGTPDYLSPEQARNLHQVDIRSDLYSLGCTFYYLLTGRVPFPGGTTLEKLVRHSTEMATPLEQLRSDVSPAVAAVVRRLMAKDPRQRFQTPTELVAGLSPFSAQTPTPMALPVAIVAHPGAGSTAGTSAWTANNAPQLNEDEVELGALGTLNYGDTPMSFASGIPSLHLRQADQQHQHKRIRTAVFAAVGIVSAILIAGAWLLLHR
jgi:serine/threonine-protein kinase